MSPTNYPFPEYPGTSFWLMKTWSLALYYNAVQPYISWQSWFFDFVRDSECYKGILTVSEHLKRVDASPHLRILMRLDETVLLLLND